MSPTPALYLAAASATAGKSVIALGVMDILRRRVDRLGYFRPIVDGTDDRHLTLIREQFRLGDRAGFALTDAEADDLLAAGRQDELYQRVLADYHDLAARCDFVFVEGTDFTGGHAALEFEFNARLASHLAAPVVVLLSGLRHEVDEIVDAVRVAERALGDHGAAAAAAIINRVRPDRIVDVRDRLDELELWSGVIPDADELASPSLGEVTRALGATALDSSAAVDDVLVGGIQVAAMSLPNLLDRLTDRALVVAPGDRADVIVGVLASHLSANCANVAGLLLSGGIEPAPQIIELIDGLGGIPVPIYLTERDTFATVDAVTAVRSVITADAPLKIASALSLFEQHIDGEALLDHIALSPPTTVTPLMFEYQLIERARSDRQHIVLPEGTDERVVRAAGVLQRRGVARLTLLGPREAVVSLGAQLGVDIDRSGDDRIAVIDPATSDDRARYAQAYADERAHKGVTFDTALEIMRDVSYFATMMVHLGDADGMVSGAAHTTAHTIRPAFEFIKTRPGVDNVSSVFLMCLADRVLVYGDCAIIPNPTPDQLADIAIASADTARIFGIDPRVAMLSYSTGTSGSGEDVEWVARATELVRARSPELAVEGPIQYDAAVDAGVGTTKLPDSTVAGRATVFIFPDLNTGNNTYKAVQRSAGAVAIGPVLQGLNKPVNDLSRGALVADIVNTVAITAIQAQLVERRTDD